MVVKKIDKMYSAHFITPLYILDSTTRFFQPLYYFVIKKIRTCLRTFLQQLSKCSRADWLVAIVHKSTDNKNYVRYNPRAFSTEEM